MLTLLDYLEAKYSAPAMLPKEAKDLTISAWCDRLLARPSWQATEATPETIAAFKSRMARTIH